MSKDILLALIGQGKHQVVSTFSAVPDDKLTWKPLDNGRSALDLFCEVAGTFKMASEFVASRGEDKPSYEKFKQMKIESAEWGREEALAAMETNYAAFVAQFETVDDELLASPITVPVGGGGMTEPFGVWAMMTYRTCVSRFAQINYIQTLYGDMESH
jgi:hypothetical protein